MNISSTQLERARSAIGSGFIAQRFAIEHWALFCSWARAQQPGSSWTDDDKPHMDADSKVLYAIGGFDD